MNFVDRNDDAIARADTAAMHQECCICYDSLCGDEVSPVVCLASSENNRVCRHFYHQDCIQGMISRRPHHEDNDDEDSFFLYESQKWLHRCPMCNADFDRFIPVPNPLTEPQNFFRFLDLDGNNVLSQNEIIDGLKAVVPLSYTRIEQDAENLWVRWDADHNGTISIDEFSDPTNGVIAYLRDPSNSYRIDNRGPIPNLLNEAIAWFEYWDEDHNGTLDKSEMYRAITKTLRLQLDGGGASSQGVAEFLDEISFLFDSDGDGVITVEEFLQPDGLAETVAAYLPQL